MNMTAGWLDSLSAWLWKVIKEFWDSLVAFVGDLFVIWLEQSLNAILYVVNLLPMPSFMEGQSIGSLMGQAGNTVLWFADVFSIGPALAMLGVAMAFYVVRRVLTLGIW